MRATTALSHILGLEGAWVREVTFEADRVVVDVALRARQLSCPDCEYRSMARYDTRPDPSTWRHLDLGSARLELRARLRRLVCPTHGVRVEAVPFARPGSRFSSDFEDLVAWMATVMDKTAICRLTRIDWDSVGRIISRVMDHAIDVDRLEGLFRVGIDDVSWRRRHHYLTLVSDHDRARIVWGAAGRDTATADRFFDELGTERSEALEAVSADMAAAYTNPVKAHATNAVICYDPFHVVQLATTALDKIRRRASNDMRNVDPTRAKKFKGARWCLLKNPADLNDDQAATLRKLKRKGGELWRAYTLKEALRAVFAGDLAEAEVAELLDRFCSRASRSGLKEFVTVAKTIRKHRAGILAAVRLGINNARHEGLNRRVRLIVNRAYGFHSPQAALALIMVTLGPINHVLPHERTPVPTG